VIDAASSVGWDKAVWDGGTVIGAMVNNSLQPADYKAKEDLSNPNPQNGKMAKGSGWKILQTSGPVRTCIHGR